MNFEIFKNSVPDECIEAFIRKNLRYDSRNFKDVRKFSYQNSIFEEEKYSCIGSLGLNKVMIVLKEEKNDDKKNEFINVKIENLEKSKVDNIIEMTNYVNKLICNNIILINENDESSKNKSYFFHIVIESNDGNLYDTISSTLIELLLKNSSLNLKFKMPFVTRTFCSLFGELLYDPSEEEKKQCQFAFNIIKFTNDNHIYFHKIKGDFIQWEKIKLLVNEF